jgi:hypothetical protein
LEDKNMEEGYADPQSQSDCFQDAATARRHKRDLEDMALGTVLAFILLVVILGTVFFCLRPDEDDDKAPLPETHPSELSYNPALSRDLTRKKNEGSISILEDSNYSFNNLIMIKIDCRDASFHGMATVTAGNYLKFEQPVVCRMEAPNSFSITKTSKGFDVFTDRSERTTAFDTSYTEQIIARANAALVAISIKEKRDNSWK